MSALGVCKPVISTFKRLGAVFVAWLATFITGIFVGGDLFWASYWFGWFFVVFMVPELFFAFTNSRYTLSDETWRFESLHYNPARPFSFADWTGVHWLFAVVYLIFMTLLGIHLVFGLKLFIVAG